MRKKELNKDQIFGVAFLGLLSLMVYDWKIGIVLTIISVIVYVLINKEMRKNKEKKMETINKSINEKRRVSLIEKFGEETGMMIFNGTEVKIGMTKEIVSEIWGTSFSSQKKVTEVKTKEKYFYEGGNSTKHKKYAIFENNVLVEYGEL